MWPFAEAPPIIIRFDPANGVLVHFTNTSDKILYGITVTASEDGKDVSRVIVDSIEPHKTVTVSLGEAIAAGMRPLTKVGITCKAYTKPLIVEVSW